MLLVCGDIMDTLGSSISSLTGFITLVVELARHVHPVGVIVDLPLLLNMEEGSFRGLKHEPSTGLPLFASGIPLGRLLNTTLLARRLGFTLAEKHTSWQCSPDTADIHIHRNARTRLHGKEGTPFVGPSLDGGLDAFKESFRRIELFHHERLNAGQHSTTVFIQMMQYGIASCAVPVFANTIHDVMDAMQFADDLQPLLSFPQPCAYAYLRTGFAQKSNVKILHENNSLYHQVPLRLYAKAVGYVLHEAGLNCLTINYPKKGYEAEKAVLQLQDAAKATLHPFHVRGKAAQEVRDPNAAAGMHNLRELRTAFESPLLLSEVATLWSDWILYKRMSAGRPSAVLSADENSPWVHVYSREILHAMHSRAHLPDLLLPGAPHGKPCIFFRGTCVPDHELFLTFRPCAMQPPPSPAPRPPLL